MANLESSLTAIDWLQNLGPSFAVRVKNGVDDIGQGNKFSSGISSIRKGSNSPMDANGCVDSADSQPQKDGKPPYSYANLITFAINSSLNKRMTLSEIYSWICENFPFYKDAGNGWKVSITILHQYFLAESEQIDSPGSGFSVSERRNVHLLVK